MKNKLIIFSVFASILAMSALFVYSSDAKAHSWRHGGGHYYWHPGYGWAVPVVVTGAIIYSASRPPVVIQQYPTYIQMPPPVAPVFPQPADMHWEAILDANCNCYRTVLVPNKN